MAQVRIDRVSKSFGSNEVVRELSLDVRDQEFLVLVGPSGCGKSTLLRMVAGLEQLSAGAISIGEREVNDLPPKDRDIAMVFQNYALYPHMDVRRNMGFGLKMRGYPKGEVEQRVLEAARILEIEPLLGRKPSQLSGGQRQRVAMGRAIVRKPAAFLFDEPLSNLDAKLRVQMRLEIKRLHRTLGTTIIYVTHDQIEAMTLADRVAVMHRGVLQQVAPPLEIYHQPANLFVAGFIGSPPINLIAGAISRSDQGSLLRAEGLEIVLPDNGRLAALGQERRVVLGIRPEHLRIAPRPDRPAAVFSGVVEVVEPLGSEVVLYLRVGPLLLAATTDPDRAAAPGDTLTLHAEVDALKVFDAQTEINLLDKGESSK
ncbi:MAG: sn-glycerol-3-phosphate ABC transporter ATP-binding protein UgpC [Candidatus Alcyoniella australis]|nr:sn-glycerol-3-phosphate ABC transporter ATP-binding protein UgpC [Candidatus Alcyoniella australis]